MELLLGLAMFYSWIHGAIIVGKKIKNLTQYEKVVLVFAVSAFALFVIGTIS